RRLWLSRSHRRILTRGSFTLPSQISERSLLTSRPTLQQGHMNLVWRVGALGQRTWSSMRRAACTARFTAITGESAFIRLCTETVCPTTCFKIPEEHHLWLSCATGVGSSSVSYLLPVLPIM
uniref:Uncharacterized protein n=1 Tax=Aegilops tauschii subsp. strangulata TaxID=200361 RepID=A0A453FHH4_AEGTS